jgi:hypothetical protein
VLSADLDFWNHSACPRRHSPGRGCARQLSVSIDGVSLPEEHQGASARPIQVTIDPTHSSLPDPYETSDDVKVRDAASGLS